MFLFFKTSNFQLLVILYTKLDRKYLTKCKKLLLESVLIYYEPNLVTQKKPARFFITYPKPTKITRVWVFRLGYGLTTKVPYLVIYDGDKSQQCCAPWLGL